MCDKAIINIDDKYSSYFIKESNTNYTYGTTNSDYIISDITINDNGTSFKVNNKLYNTKLLGTYNVYNIVNTIIVLDILGICDETKYSLISKLNPPVGRLEVINYNNSKIIVDYAHTPDAVNKVINCVRSFSKGKNITIIGCGGNRDKSKRSIMADNSTNLSDFSIFTSDNPRYENQCDIFNDMLKGLKKENLRDNMTNLELVLNMLAEVTTTSISRTRKPNTFEESRQIAREGGSVARDTRRNIESRIGQSVISTTNAHDKLALDVTIPAIEQPDVIEENKEDDSSKDK